MISLTGADQAMQVPVSKLLTDWNRAKSDCQDFSLATGLLPGSSRPKASSRAASLPSLLRAQCPGGEK
jgi:hypothetical protein